MSDLSPDERPQPQRARRATRPKAKAYTARRAQKPAASSAGAESLAGPTSSETRAAAAHDALETAIQEAASETEPEVAETAGKKWPIQVRGMTILSKEILLWATIVALGSLVLTIGPGLVLGAFNVTDQDIKNNAGLAEGWSCFSLILLYALPAVGGWRATLRQGDWKQGGLTGFWSVLLLEILLLIISAIYDAAIGKFAQFTSLDWGGLLVTLVIQMLVSFGLGAMGGYFSVWQRRRAAQSQELLSSSS